MKLASPLVLALCLSCSSSAPPTPSCLSRVGDLCLIGRIAGDAHGGELGFRFDSPRDVDGDGIGDIAAGARFTRFPERPTSQAGTASVWSGRSHATLMSWHGSQVDGLFGHAAALVPDISGDGLADLVVASPTARLPKGGSRGTVWARSVKGGAMLWTRSGEVGASFGWDLASTHDHDGDGVADLFVGAPAGRIGRVYLLSGAKGEILRTYDSTSQKDSFGWYVSTVADMDGDGRDELVVGAPMWGQPERAMVGAAEIRSSASGATLHRWTGKHPGAQYGEIVCGLPDIDGDGVADIAVSATYTRATVGVREGEVFVYSGAKGRVIHHFTGRQVGELFGRMVARVGDLDRDGVEDIAIGAPWHEVDGKERAGRLEIRSGASGALLSELIGSQADQWLGWHVAPATQLGKRRESGFVMSLLRSQENQVRGAGVLEVYVYRPAS